MTTLTFVLIFLAGLFNSICDNITHHWSTSIFNSPKFNAQWWNPAISWKNKYIDNDPTKGRKYFKILGIKIYNNVFFTDAWHMFKMLMLGCFFFAITTAKGYTPIFTWYIDPILIQLTFVAAFHLFYTKIWRK